MSRSINHPYFLRKSKRDEFWYNVAMKNFILPGLIDLHIHGAFGWDFSFGDPDKIDEMLDRMLTCGLTGVMATLITCREERRMKALRDISVVAARRKKPPHILGIYMEGPFLAKSRCGSHPKEMLIKPDLKKLIKIFR